MQLYGRAQVSVLSILSKECYRRDFFHCGSLDIENILERKLPDVLASLVVQRMRSVGSVGPIEFAKGKELLRSPFHFFVPHFNERLSKGCRKVVAPRTHTRRTNNATVSRSFSFRSFHFRLVPCQRTTTRLTKRFRGLRLHTRRRAPALARKVGTAQSRDASRSCARRSACGDPS